MTEFLYGVLALLVLLAALHVNGVFSGFIHRWKLAHWRVVSTYPKAVSCVRCGAGAFSALRREGKPDEPMCPECLRGKRPEVTELEYRIPPKGERKYEASDLRWAARTARDYVKTEDET